MKAIFQIKSIKLNTLTVYFKDFIVFFSRIFFLLILKNINKVLFFDNIYNVKIQQLKKERIFVNIIFVHRYID